MDCGDIDYVPGDLEQTFGNIEAAVRLLRSRGLPACGAGGATTPSPSRSPGGWTSPAPSM